MVFNKLLTASSLSSFLYECFTDILHVNISYFSLAVTENYDQGNGQKEGFIWWWWLQSHHLWDTLRRHPLWVLPLLASQTPHLTLNSWSCPHLYSNIKPGLFHILLGKRDHSPFSCLSLLTALLRPRCPFCPSVSEQTTAWAELSSSMS